MQVNGRDYVVRFDAADRRVAFQGTLRLRSAREYDDVKSLLRSAHAAPGGSLELDFRGLEYLNSSGIGMIGQFIVEARRADTVQIVLRGSADRPWQARSLGTFQRIWPKVQLEIESPS